MGRVRFVSVNLKLKMNSSNQYRNTGAQKSVKNAKKRKILTKEIRKGPRLSIECIDCLKFDNCKDKNTLAFFENRKNVELDCWNRKVYSSLFHTGLHKGVYLKIENPFSRKNNYVYNWLHGVNPSFDLITTKFEKN